MNISDNVRRCCELAGLNQRDVAGICGVTQPTVSSWFSGKTKIPLECAYELKKHLGVTLDELVGNVMPGSESQEVLQIFGLLNDAGKAYLLKQARFALLMEEYR